MNKYGEHIRALAKRHNIHITYMKTGVPWAQVNSKDFMVEAPPSFCESPAIDPYNIVFPKAHTLHEGFAGIVGIYPIRTLTDYWCALHEIGHILTDEFYNGRVENEYAAWKWAMNEALIWTNEAEYLMTRTLNSYFAAAYLYEVVLGKKRQNYAEYAILPRLRHPAWKYCRVKLPKMWWWRRRTKYPKELRELIEETIDLNDKFTGAVLYPKFGKKDTYYAKKPLLKIPPSKRPSTKRRRRKSPLVP